MNAKTLINYFRSLYTSRYRKEYPVSWAKHGKIISDLRKIYPDKDLREFLWLHVFDGNEFTERVGHSLETLRSQIPRYIQIIENKKKAVVSKDQTDYDRLQKFRSPG